MTSVACLILIYLVVLNQKKQFARGRYAYVENSKARAVFSHYRLSLKNVKLVQFGLGKYAGTDVGDQQDGLSGYYTGVRRRS